MNELYIYNTISGKKEKFKPIKEGHVGMYVCGPTVYGDPHLGHARPYITFDVLLRYLKHKGLKVRYVRNITDVGHLVNDLDDGEDKIVKKAKLDQLEPMEVVQQYTISFKKAMDDLNNLTPSIEPTASGHIIEQIKLTEQILANGYAYESNGSVYFDVKKYNEDHDYGILSGRNIEEMIDGASSRDLDGSSDKKNGVDFALWKKAGPEHIMRWPSPWGDGFPGWHLECTAMSTKYLGDTFDIHAGGMDLKFPHHEAEIAQSKASCGCSPAKYWMHNNMITINGQKMGKSLGNFINLPNLFSGDHELLEEAYSPMTVRFFILQTHYRSPLDFSNDALKSGEKGLKRLLSAVKTSSELVYQDGSFEEEYDDKINGLMDACYEHMNDDINTAQTLARLFDLSTEINSLYHEKKPVEALKVATLARLKSFMPMFVNEILGLEGEGVNGDGSKMDDVMHLLIDIRKDARANKDWVTSDKIRDRLTEIGIQLKDEKDGTTFSIEK